MNRWDYALIAAVVGMVAMMVGVFEEIGWLCWLAAAVVAFTLAYAVLLSVIEWWSEYREASRAARGSRRR